MYVKKYSPKYCRTAYIFKLRISFSYQYINILKTSKDTIVSRAKFTRSARRTVYLYARPKVETIRDYQISITAEPIELIISSIDSAYPNYIRKICLFLLYVLYEKSYYNVKCKNKKIYLMYVRMYVCTLSNFRR